DNCGACDGVPGAEIVERIDIDLAPGAEEGLALAARLARRGCLYRPHAALARRHRADGGDAGVDEHDLLLARSIGVELLMPDMEAILDVGDQRGRIEVDAFEGNVDLEDLLAIAHLGGALDRDRTIEPAAQTRDGALLQLDKDLVDLGSRRVRAGLEVRAA